MAGWSLWALATIGGAILLLGDWAGLPLIGLLLMFGVGCFVINVISIARHWFSAAHPSLARPFAGHRLA
jgi:hypothetical protein